MNRVFFSFSLSPISFIVAAGFLIQSANVSAATKPTNNPYEWKHDTHSVAVFKNGMGFFMREGETQLRDGWCVAEEVPPAAFGTFAVYSHDEGNVVDIVGYGPGELVDLNETPYDKKVDAITQVLTDRLHLRLAITYEREGRNQEANGLLVEIGEKYAILKDKNNNFAVPINSINKVRILENPMRVHVVDENEKPVKNSKIGMMYMREGITWIPDYTLEVIDDDSAKLTLRGTLINEAEDLIDCDVHFVVGVPNFAHSNHMAPIAIGSAMRSTAASFSSPILSQQIVSNAHLSVNSFDPELNPSGSQPWAFPSAEQITAGLPRMDGASETDFTVYTKENLTVRKGEKAIVTLMSVEVNYGHRYRWTVGESMKHYFVLQNNTSTAWTTGPCLGIEGHHPLTEDLLKYTPKGGFAELPVTSAINVFHTNVEQEIERELKAYNPFGEKNREYPSNFYDLVTLGGKLELKNFADHTADIVITVPVTGRPFEASDGGTFRTNTELLQLLKRTGSVSWSVNIEPNDTQTLTYNYERYVKSQ